jgi:SAM-dependent methyltransferase
VYDCRRPGDARSFAADRHARPPIASRKIASAAKTSLTNTPPARGSRRQTPSSRARTASGEPATREHDRDAPRTRVGGGTFRIERCGTIGHDVTAGFRDYFSAGAGAYARYRPSYPPELLARLAALAPGRGCCWDVATGTGQAARALAEHFDRVIATDASARQLAHALPHPRIDYRVELAERSTLADASVDLITIAAGLHWLTLEPFYAEVRRVARPGAVIAAWSYSTHLGLGAALDPIVADHVDRVLGPYWPEGYVHIRGAYRTLAFPFAEIDVPPATLTFTCALDELVGVVGTWSASTQYRAALGRDPSAELAAALARAWGPEPTRTARLPLFFRVGRIGPHPA